MKKKLLALFVCCIFLNYTHAQTINPVIQWQKCLGGTNEDGATSIQRTKDGGYVVAGTASSTDGNVSGNHGEFDYWVVKITSMGSIQWQKALGGSEEDEADCIQQTKDGGYVVSGVSFSNDGDVSGNHGGGDDWIVKLDSNGNIQWQKCLGGADWDEAHSIQQTTDGGYIVAGRSNSVDGDVKGHHGGTNFSDFWIVKLDGNGNIQWQECLGGKYWDEAYSIQLTTDGGYIVAGFTQSDNGDVTGNNGTFDYWVVKLNRKGNIEWQKCLGGKLKDEARSIQQTKEGGYIVAGFTSSNDGDVRGNHGTNQTGDYWIVKLNSKGTIEWQKCLGGTGDETATSIAQSADGGYIVAGYSNSNDGDVSGNHNNATFDAWIVKLNGIGDIQYQTCLGGTDADEAWDVKITTDGGYVIAGSASSDNGDVRGHHGSNILDDYWVVKSKPYNLISSPINSPALVQQKQMIVLAPNPSHTGVFNVNMGMIKNNIFIAVTNNTGRTVYTKNLSAAQQLNIYLNNQPKGIYHLYLRYNGGTQTKNLIIE